MTDDARADDKGAVPFGRSPWADLGGVDPFAETGAPARDSASEQVTAPPWRQVQRTPVWPVPPAERATGPITTETGPVGFAVGRVGVGTGPVDVTAEQPLVDPSSVDAFADPYAADPYSAYPYAADRPRPVASHHAGAAAPAGRPPGPRWDARAWLALAAVVVLALAIAAGLVLSPRAAKNHATSAATRQPAGVGAGGSTAGPTGQPSGAAAGPPEIIGTYEAEAGGNTLSGGALVVNYRGASGGRVVKNIGDWKNAAGPGSLTFAGVTAPASGAYTLIFYYVHVNSDPMRTAVITVSGADPIDVTVSGGAVCCTKQAVAVRLAAGRNEITFGNPHGTAPALDKIEIVKGAPA